MKRNAMQIMIRCAQIYKENLLNKNMLIITSKNNKIEHLEIRFPKSAYLHLTGVDVGVDRDGNKISANDFFKLCSKRKISLNNFEFKDDGTTRLKLDVLENVLKINSSVKMVTIYNGRRPKLYTEKLAGNVTACMGLVKDDYENYYVPNTILKSDVRDEGTDVERVLAIMEKQENEEVYENIIYTAKKIKLNELNIPKNIKDKINCTIL